MDKVLEYPLAPVSMTLLCSDDTHQKTTKSKFCDAVLNNMEIAHGTFPNSRTIHHYLEGSVRTFIRNCETILVLSNFLMNSISGQFVEIFIACDATWNFQSRTMRECLGVKVRNMFLFVQA